MQWIAGLRGALFMAVGDSELFGGVESGGQTESSVPATVRLNVIYSSGAGEICE